MTIGIGRKFGRRIVITTDTMISNTEKGRADAIPGRLKGIVLSPYVSVAYAGDANPALDTIRYARQHLLKTGDAGKVAKLLLEASSRTDIDVEFILAFHENGRPHLHKITALGISHDLNDCYIGNGQIVNDVLNHEHFQRTEGHPEFGILAEESQFLSAFNAIFDERGTHIDHGVGGLPIAVIASPYGHFYQGRSTSMAWDVINLARGVTTDQHAAQRAGETAWGYSIIDGQLRGVPVVGVALPQAGVGYVHAPIHWDDAEIIRTGVPEGTGFIDSTRLISAVSARVNELREADGSGVDELDAPWE